LTANTVELDASALPVTQRITGTYSNNGTLSNATWEDLSNPNCGGGCALNTGNFQDMTRVN
jgi:hypothetical protein